MRFVSEATFLFLVAISEVACVGCIRFDDAGGEIGCSDSDAYNSPMSRIGRSCVKEVANETLLPAKNPSCRPRNDRRAQVAGYAERGFTF